MLNSLVRALLTASLSLAITLPTFGQNVFSDDFQTVATYNSASLLAPCYGGSPTRYTLIEGQSGDIFNAQAVSGAGRFRISNADLGPFLADGVGVIDLCIAGWMGVGAGCPGEPPLFNTTEPFTAVNICMYGGYTFNRYQLSQVAAGSAAGAEFGPDLQPGVAGVDDDGDGTTDNVPFIGFSNPFQSPPLGEYQWPGADGQPGVAGVDDDGINGTDDQGELTWPGSDDSDDTLGDQGLSAGMRNELSNTDLIFVTVTTTSTGNQFSIREIINAVLINGPEQSNELPAGFYKPFTEYSYVFCSSGTCYGAMMWQDANIANPQETLGPVVNTTHTGAGLGFGVNSLGNGVHSLIQNMTFLGNRNFSNTFWAMEGDPLTSFPSPSTDLDGDKDVDASDFLTFSNCFNGSLNPPKGICGNLDADLDNDGDVDASDFLTFSNCFNGSLSRPKAICFPPNLTACP